MDYKKTENEYYLRIDKGEEIVSKILDLCKKENIKTAHFQGIGACDKVICQTLDIKNHTFINHEKTGMLEMISLLGNIAEDDSGNLSFHAHASFSYIEGDDVKLFGGHLREAYVCYTGEIIVSPTEHTVKRSTETGMNLWKFN